MMKATDIMPLGLKHDNGNYVVGNEVLGRGMSPTDLSNWTLVEKIEMDGSEASRTVAIPGNGRYMINYYSAENTNIGVKPNGANADHIAQQVGGDTHNGTSFSSYAAGGILITNGGGSCICDIMAWDGKVIGTANVTRYASNYVQQIGSACTISGELSYLEFVPWASSTTVTGTAEIYKWQEAKATSLASWELVKEYDLSNETLSDTITVDEPDAEYRFVGVSSSGSVMMTFNGDTGANYAIRRIYSNNGTPTMTSGMNSGISVTYGTREIETTVRINAGRAFASLDMNDSGLWGRAYSEWIGDVSTITVGTLEASTCSIKVYKLVKSQVLQSGYGLWKKFKFDNETVDFTLDLSEFDGDEIMVNGLSEGSPNGVTIYANGDNSSSYRRSYFSQAGSTISAANEASNRLGRAIGGSPGEPSASKCTIWPGVKTCKYEIMFAAGSTDQRMHTSSVKYTGGTMASLQFSSDGLPVTGTISIYRL